MKENNEIIKRLVVIFFDALLSGQFKYAHMVLHTIIFGKKVKEKRMKELKLGDVVRKKTGGPKMTINDYVDGRCECKWFEGGKLFEGFFSEESLMRI